VKVKKKLDKIIDSISIFILVAMVFFTFLQVVGRYIFRHPPSWTEEVARYLSVWLTFLGAAIAFRTWEHLGVDFFVNRMPDSIQKVVMFFINLILSIILILLVWKGYNMTLFAVRQLSPAMRIPMAIPYAAIPVGCSLMLLEVLLNFVRIKKGEEAH